MFFRLKCCGNGIEDMPGDILVLQGDGVSLNKYLEGLPIFTLKHHFELFPVSLEVFFLCINIKGFQEVDGASVETN